MATTGTTNFNPDVAEIMEEAFERAGTDMRNSNHVKSARRSLNLIALEWQNAGLNLWTVDEQSIPSSSIVAGTAEYDLGMDTIGIIEAAIRTDDGVSGSQSDLTVSKLSTTEYAQITDKLTQGRPVQYWFRRTGVDGGSSTGADVTPKVRFYPIPDETDKYTFVYWRMRRIQDMDGSITNTVDVPSRFIPALISCLALHLYEKLPPDQTNGLKARRLLDKKLEDWALATEEDREKVDFFIKPDLSAY